MRNLLRMAAFICFSFYAASASAVWRVDIESKSVTIGEHDVTVAVKLYTDLPVSQVSIPLVVRELDPGSFWTGDLPVDTNGGEARGVIWNWLSTSPWPSFSQDYRPGPGCAVPDNEYDGVSPDNFLIHAMGVSDVEQPAPSGHEIVYFNFDVTNNPGQFEIDTACFYSNTIHRIFLIQAGWCYDPPCDQAVEPYFTFNKGIVTIDECDCSTLGDCNGDGEINPVDVVYMVNYVYLGFVPPPPAIHGCPGVNGDWNCDGAINPIDLVRLVRYVYLPNALDPCDPCLLGEPPDLLIRTSELYINPNPVEVNQPVSIWAWMYNIGGTTAPSPTIDIYQGDPDAGGILLASYVSGDVPPGQQSSYYGSHDFSFSTVGPVEIYAVVDYGDAIAEINEDNNITHETLEVVPAGAAPLILKENKVAIPPQLPPRR